MNHRLHNTGFTLLELLVVVGLIAVLSVVLTGGLRGGRTAVLQTGQATLVSIVTTARMKAASSGCRVRILINAETTDAARFRRTLAVQQEAAADSNTWEPPFLVTALPDGVYLLPYRNRIPAGFYDDPAAWTKSATAAPLESTSLSAAPVAAAIESPVAQAWDLIQFTPAGTLSTGTGDLVLAMGTPRSPGSVLAGESPVQVSNPDRVRGLSLSTYGTPVLVDNRRGF